MFPFWMIVVLLTFLSHVICRTDYKPDDIIKLYNTYYWDLHKAYYSYRNKNATETICHKNPIIAERMKTKTKISIMTHLEEDKDLFVTLDGKNKFRTPAIVKCSAIFNYEMEESFWLIARLGEIMLLEVFNISSIFTSKEAHFFLSIQKTFVDEAKKWNSDIRRNLNHNEQEVCQSVCEKKENPDSRVTNGRIAYGKYVLIGSNFINNYIDLPAVLVCEVKFSDSDITNLKFFIHVQNYSWRKIYDQHILQDTKPVFEIYAEGINETLAYINSNH